MSLVVWSEATVTNSSRSPIITNLCPYHTFGSYKNNECLRRHVSMNRRASQWPYVRLIRIWFLFGKFCINFHIASNHWHATHSTSYRALTQPHTHLTPLTVSVLHLSSLPHHPNYIIPIYSSAHCIIGGDSEEQEYPFLFVLHYHRSLAYFLLHLAFVYFQWSNCPKNELKMKNERVRCGEKCGILFRRKSFQVHHNNSI